ncbi:hypothetical protein ABXJ56_15680 [Microbacterium chocolatum]|uniref:hypothetical protein n=1 Tax=Microbacterium aurantiacum TaxID=162393 RepID=UPI00338ECB74
MNKLTPSDARRLRVLLAVYQVAHGKTGEGVATDDLERHLDGALDIDRDSLEDILQGLWDQRLVIGFRGGDGLNTVFLQPHGKDLAMQFDRMRSDPTLRVRELQDAYLRWLYVQTEEQGLHPTVSDYLATSPGFYGSPYTDQELMKAGTRLKNNGFIEGEGRYSYPAPAQPQLTARGRLVIEKNRSVHDEPHQPAPQYFNTTVHGNANVANASPGSNQVFLVDSEWAAKSTAVLDAIEQALSTLPPDMSTTAAALVADARHAVETNSPSRTKRALTALGSFLGDTTAGALGGLLSAQAIAVTSLLGG